MRFGVLDRDFFWDLLGGSIWGISGLVETPREDSSSLAGFDCLGCTVFGVSICAGGVICSTVFCSGVSGPRMVLIFSAFKVGCVEEVGGSASLANSWNQDDSCSIPGLVNFLLAEMFVFI